MLLEKNCPSTDSPAEPPKWNASDYQTNNEYYGNLSNSRIFTQEDNLLLDRISWPKFCPTDGSKLMYLRKQYHMPDFNGSSTTLHWLDLTDPTSPTVRQLTRPIWGINDRQVKRNKLFERTHLYIHYLKPFTN